MTRVRRNSERTESNTSCIVCFENVRGSDVKRIVKRHLNTVSTQTTKIEIGSE